MHSPAWPWSMAWTTPSTPDDPGSVPVKNSLAHYTIIQPAMLPLNIPGISHNTRRVAAASSTSGGISGSMHTSLTEDHHNRHNSETPTPTPIYKHVTPAKPQSTWLTVAKSSIRDGKTVALDDTGAPAIMTVRPRVGHTKCCCKDLDQKERRNRQTTDTHTVQWVTIATQATASSCRRRSLCHEIQCSAVNHGNTK